MVSFIIHSSRIPARGMALFPFILVKYREDLTDPQLIRHERIHIRQQAELLILPFYVLYLLNYVWNRLKGESHAQAYFNICFEREAYRNESDATYLQGRRWGSFIRYL